MLKPDVLKVGDQGLLHFEVRTLATSTAVMYHLKSDVTLNKRFAVQRPYQNLKDLNRDELDVVKATTKEHKSAAERQIFSVKSLPASHDE
ncbi:MAG: hypothetical protein K9M98_09410 [Cephaloticoccus sp.]|nr:hypothetical protein [Cephaloticoccus sp.]MCF7760709.1 hypothetical protein [Cephaloticoccus sp.]